MKNTPFRPGIDMLKYISYGIEVQSMLSHSSIKRPDAIAPGLCMPVMWQVYWQVFRLTSSRKNDVGKVESVVDLK